MVSPSFFFRVPEKTPRTVWRCHSLDALAAVDQFAETLATAGIDRIYGIVGDSLNGLTDAIRRQGQIEWVHLRHEEVVPSQRVGRRISQIFVCVDDLVRPLLALEGIDFGSETHIKSSDVE